MSEGLRRAQALGATWHRSAPIQTARTRYTIPWASPSLTCSSRGLRNGRAVFRETPRRR
jgi:hypothetical protein